MRLMWAFDCSPEALVRLNFSIMHLHFVWFPEAWQLYLKILVIYYSDILARDNSHFENRISYI